MSNRKNDTRGERALGLFLDRFFYPQFCAIEGLTNTERIYDSVAQKDGCDVIIRTSAGATIAVDEKAQLHYINEPRTTFAFEISYYSDNALKIVDGWFVSSSNKTDYYNLVWIDSARIDQINRLVEEDFKEITVAFVSKKKIIQYLSNKGFSIDYIKGIARELRENEEDRKIELSNGVFLFYSSEGYDEKPINIVVDRRILMDLAYGTYKVTRNNCQKLSR